MLTKRTAVSSAQESGLKKKKNWKSFALFYNFVIFWQHILFYSLNIYEYFCKVKKSLYFIGVFFFVHFCFVLLFLWLELYIIKYQVCTQNLGGNEVFHIMQTMPREGEVIQLIFLISSKILRNFSDDSPIYLDAP